MKREHDLKKRLASLAALRDTVAAMKSLSAHHLREARGSLDAVARYRHDIQAIAHLAGAQLPAGGGAIGLLVLGAELGLCGGYNARLADTAVAHRNQIGAGPTVVVGRRIQSALQRRGLDAQHTFSAPTIAAGLDHKLLDVLETLLPLYLEHRLSAVDVVATPYAGVGAQEPRVARLLPLTSAAALPARGERPPRLVSPDTVAQWAARELVYVTLYDLMLDALAAEHSARLLSTQAAENWLSARYTTLSRRLASARREASTQEVIEIAAGARLRLRPGIENHSCLFSITHTPTGDSCAHEKNG